MFSSTRCRSSAIPRLDKTLAEKMTEAVVDGVMCVAEEERPIDLHRWKYSRFVNGVVLDNGARHLDMANSLTYRHIMTCNVTFEWVLRVIVSFVHVSFSFFYSITVPRYKRIEVRSGFFYNSAEELPGGGQFQKVCM